MICTYCGYTSLTIVRDYAGAPYATCPRCYRSNPFYRTGRPGSLLEPPPPEQIRVRAGHEVEPREVNRHLSQRFL
jgi:hypothetical protein